MQEIYQLLGDQHCFGDCQEILLPSSYADMISETNHIPIVTIVFALEDSVSKKIIIDTNWNRINSFDTAFW